MCELCKKFKLNELSMGMSNDYKLAIENGATFIRIRVKNFWKRLSNFYFCIFFNNLIKIKKSCNLRDTSSSWFYNYLLRCIKIALPLPNIGFLKYIFYRNNKIIF